MANNDGEKCTLKFKSRGDFYSALIAAERLDIPVEKIGKGENLLIAVCADRVRTFQSLGSINFGIEVGA